MMDESDAFSSSAALEQHELNARFLGLQREMAALTAEAQAIVEGGRNAAHERSRSAASSTPRRPKWRLPNHVARDASDPFAMDSTEDLRQRRDDLEGRVRAVARAVNDLAEAESEADARHMLDVATLEDEIAAIVTLPPRSDEPPSTTRAASSTPTKSAPDADEAKPYAAGTPSRAKLDALLAVTSPEVDRATAAKASAILRRRQAKRKAEYDALQAELLEVLDRQHQLHGAIAQRRSIIMDDADPITVDS
uniref:Uncharacterized protein n=1 Tax=Neobodo designis TaxID=312471 RepID=A0A7S1LFQ1_NEODS